jgi:DNA polymerase-3 subunit delta'
MDYGDIIENTRAFKLLTGGGLSHAYMLTGADPLALEILAERFALTVSRKSDILRVPAAFGARVTVEEINALVSYCLLMPFDSERKVYIVYGADNMTDQAQNKLLKTLEEPPKTVVIILCAADEHRILRTVRSRCRAVNCLPIEEKVIFERLIAGGVPADKAEFAAGYAGGSLFETERLLNDPAYGDAAEAVRDVFFDLKKGADILRHAARLSAFKDKGTAVLNFMLYRTRDILAALSGRGDLVFTKRGANDIMALKDGFTAEACLSIIERINTAYKRLYYNCNYQAVVDELLFGFAEARA